MPTRFLDGPAEGTMLDLHRAPVFLRVVIGDTDGKVDALDQLDDEPQATERVHVYRIVAGTRGQVFACTRSGRGGGEFWYGDYRHQADVDGEQVRDTVAWRQWCEDRADQEGLAA